MKRRDESGQVMVLALGLALVVFAVAGLAVDGTRVFLLRRSLQNVADAAAVTAASSIDRRAYYASGGRAVALDEGAAEEAAAAVVEQRHLPLALDVVAEDGVIGVVARSESSTTLLRLVGVERVEVAASASAAPFPQLVPATP